jgi:hypothetical protein
MRAIVKQNLKWQRVLFLFIIANAIYVLMLMVTVPMVIGYSGGMPILDLMPLGYDMEYVNNLFDTLGEEGRSAYLYRQLPVDMVYPLFFAISYSLLMGFVLKGLGKLDSGWFYLCLLPVFGGLGDYAENIGIIGLLQSYPDLNENLVAFARAASVFKSMTTTLFFLTLIVAVAILGGKSLLRRT